MPHNSRDKVMDISPGSQLGPYEIVSRIGAGGMGEVFKARDTRLDRSVAIKVLPAELAANAQLRLRLEREARAISQLNHPNICTLFDVGDGFLVMELLEGETLADRITRGPLPVAQTLRLGMQIADALDKAHRAGIVHRDLKPANIMLTKSGAKLLDFGLAKPGMLGVMGPTSTEAAAPTMQRPLTQEGTILGTFQYMSPEQLEGVDADGRSDIFALGCVLYEMVTGRRAFDGKSRTSLIAAIVSSEPAPLSQIVPLTPPALEHVVQKCLAKDREDRWQSAHDIAEELRWIGDAGSQAGVATPLTMRRKSRERLAWAALAIATLIGGAFAARAFHGGEQHPVYRFSIPTAAAGHAWDFNSSISAFALSPDGRSVAFNAFDGSGKRYIWLRHMDEFEARRLDGSEGMPVGRFAPDGQSLFTATGGKLIRLPVSGAAPEVVAETSPGPVRLARSGAMINIGPDRRFYRLGSGSAAAVPITTLDKSRSEIYHTGPQILPDDEHFLFISYRRPPNATTYLHDLYVGSINGDPAVRVGDIPSRAEYANGRLFFVRDSTLMSAPFDVKTKKFTGDAVAVASNVYYFKGTGAAAFAVSEGGVVAFRSRSSDRLEWYDMRGNRLGVVNGRTNVDNKFEISPDGSQVYVAESDDRDGIHHAWAYGLTRTTRARMFAFTWANEGAPLITPDGRYAIHSSDRLDEPDIFISNVDGTDERLLVQAPGIQYPDSISRDGRFLLYDSNQGGLKTHYDIWAMPLNGNGKPFPVVQTPADEFNAQFSPDGKWVAYSSNETSVPQVYVKPFAGGGAARQVSLTGGAFPHWTHDGKSILFCSGRTMMSADFTNGAPGDPKRMFDSPETIENFEIAADGQRLLLLTATDEALSPPINVIAGWQPPSK
jgi:hypothetical protein